MPITDIIDKHDVDLTCPGCGHGIRATLADLDRYDHLTCGQCAANIQLEKSKFHGIHDARKALSEFENTLKNLFK